LAQVDEKGALRAIEFEPLSTLVRAIFLKRGTSNLLERATHDINDILEVDFDFTEKLKRLSELNVLNSNTGFHTNSSRANLARFKLKSFNSLENLRHVRHNLGGNVTVG